MDTVLGPHAVDARYRIAERVLSAATCRAIIEANRGMGSLFRARRGGEFTPHPIDDLRFLCGTAYALAAECRRTAAAFGWTFPEDVVRYGVSRYEVGQCMAMHVDDEDRDAPWDMPHRGASVSVQLSPADAYEGGDLVLLDGCERIYAPRDQGTAFSFGGTTWHEVEPVTAGERWVALAWVYANHIRRKIR